MYTPESLFACQFRNSSFNIIRDIFQSTNIFRSNEFFIHVDSSRWIRFVTSTFPQWFSMYFWTDVKMWSISVLFCYCITLQFTWRSDALESADGHIDTHTMEILSRTDNRNHWKFREVKRFWIMKQLYKHN